MEKERFTIEDENECKVFVSSLPKLVTREDLAAYFSNFGEIRTLSPFFAIGKNKNNTCAVVEFIKKESRDKVLQITHTLYRRYIDCKEYLRGEKLEKKNRDMKRRNVFLKDIGPKLEMHEIKKFFAKYGQINRVKVGFSIKDNCRYAIIYFTTEQAAITVIKEKNFIVYGYQVEANKYQERTHVDMFDVNNSSLNKSENSQNSQNSLKINQIVIPENSVKNKELQTKIAETLSKVEEGHNIYQKNHFVSVKNSSRPISTQLETEGPRSLNINTKEKKLRINKNQNSEFHPIETYPQIGLGELNAGLTINKGEEMCIGTNFSELLIKNSDDALFNVRMVSHLHLRYAHSSYNIRLNWGTTKGRRRRRRRVKASSTVKEDASEA